MINLGYIEFHKTANKKQHIKLRFLWRRTNLLVQHKSAKPWMLQLLIPIVFKAIKTQARPQSQEWSCFICGTYNICTDKIKSNSKQIKLQNDWLRKSLDFLTWTKCEQGKTAAASSHFLLLDDDDGWTKPSGFPSSTTKSCILRILFNRRYNGHISCDQIKNKKLCETTNTQASPE